jgi:hypothetical protein
MPRELRVSLVEGRCWCGDAMRGDVQWTADVPDHHCRQCAEHCELGRYLALAPASLRRRPWAWT